MAGEQISVRFDYEFSNPRKTSKMEPSDFDHCSTFDELMDELREQAPDVEFSVNPDEDDARKLWAAVEAERGKSWDEK